MFCEHFFFKGKYICLYTDINYFERPQVFSGLCAIPIALQIRDSIFSTPVADSTLCQYIVSIQEK